MAPRKGQGIRRIRREQIVAWLVAHPGLRRRGDIVRELKSAGLLAPTTAPIDCRVDDWLAKAEAAPAPQEDL